MSTLTIETEPLATDVRIVGVLLQVTLDDGRELAVPIEWFPRLRDGSASARQNWRLIGNGEGIHWPDLDTPVEECLRRISSRGNETELFEKQEFLHKVKENYERIFCTLDPEVRLVRLDGLLKKEEIAAQIQEILFNR